jgi:5-methylcytosine-specific restriction endonuclease McrA
MQLVYVPKKHACICCGVEKLDVDFYKEAYTGHRTGQCKECINIKRRVQRHKAKHGKFISKEKIRGMEVPDYTLVDWKEAMLHFRGSCAFCGKPEGRAKKEKMDRDHLVAISRGGKTVRNNIIPACTKCNRGRGNKDWLEWFVLQPSYTPERAEKIRQWQNGV